MFGRESLSRALAAAATVAALLPIPVPPLPPLPPLPPAPVPVTVVNPPAGTAPGSLPGVGGAAPPTAVPLPDGAAALAGLRGQSGGNSSEQPAEPDRRGRPQSRTKEPSVREYNRQQYLMTRQVEALDGSLDAEQARSAGGGSGVFGWPESYRRLSQGFGCTQLTLAPTSSACPSGHFHTGLDIPGPDLAGVLAADTGVVRVFPGDTGYGNYLIVTHGNGYSTLYAHLHDIVVEDGSLVERGDLLAREGSTGNSTGPHLHFEVRLGGQYLDPCPLLEDCSTLP